MTFEQIIPHIIKYWPVIAGFVAFFVVVFVIAPMFAGHRNSSHFDSLSKRG